MKYTGEVLQVIEPTWGDTVEYRIAVTKDDYGYDYDSVIYVTYARAEGESRILENDIVTFTAPATAYTPTPLPWGKGHHSKSRSQIPGTEKINGTKRTPTRVSFYRFDFISAL